MRKLNNLSCAVVLVWFTIAFSGCDVRPERKKLPEFASLQGWEDMPLAKPEKQPFLVGDTTISEGNRLSSFLSVTLADPGYDSIAMRLVNSYEPFAGFLFEKWAKQEKKGILLDLRAQPGSDIHRADFLLKKSFSDKPDIKIPLILVWDRSSAYRFDYLINALTSIPEIKCNLISESRQMEGIGRTDCFSRIEPEFE